MKAAHLSRFHSLSYYLCIRIVVSGVLLRNQEQQDDIQQESRKTGSEDRKDGITNANNGRIHIEIFGDSATYTSQDTVG